MLKELTSWQEIAAHKGEIVCFGAGMVLFHIEQLLAIHGILDKICCIVDNDLGKQGTEVSYAGKRWRILSVNDLVTEKNMKEPLIFITCEKDEEVMAQLSAVFQGNCWKVASYPKLNHLYRQKRELFLPVTRSAERCIPKKIHYIWFGSKDIPEEHKFYIDGWHRLCPGYEIVLWNEDNYDVRQCTYMREAYEAGDYAHASDYARMDILYHHGGFYMDTDVELWKNLDILSGYSAVFTYGEWPVINSGIVCGAVPGNELVKQLRDIPRSVIHYYDDNGNGDRKTNCYYESMIFRKHGFREDFTCQLRNGTAVLSPAYFASKGRHFDQHDITEHTIAVHHCVGSWKRKTLPC